MMITISNFNLEIPATVVGNRIYMLGPQLLGMRTGFM